MTHPRGPAPAMLLLLIAAVGFQPRRCLAGEALSVDPYLSIETGSDLTCSLVDLVGRLELRAFRPFEDRGAGIPVRGLRLAVFDLPVAWWFGVVEHEVFGHGGRAREFGADAGYHLASPWEGRRSYATFEGDVLEDEQILRVYAAGSESNGWTATLLERRLVAGEEPSPLTLLLVAANRFVVSDYVLRTTPDPRSEPGAFYREWAGGGDVVNYLALLHALHGGEDGISPEAVDPAIVAQWSRLRRQAVWNALDPGAWLSLWAAGRHVLTGEGPGPLPLPRLAGRRFLPVLSSDWLPEGGTASLEAAFERGGGPDAEAEGWWSVVVRRGRGPAGSFGAAGAATDCLWTRGRYRVGGEVEVWSRPGRVPGAGARLRVERRGRSGGGGFVEVGVKSAGAWPGRPAGTGPMIRMGMVLR